MPGLLAIGFGPSVAYDLARWKDCTILVLDLFTGMDGLGHALDLLQFRQQLPGQTITLLFECNNRCRQLLLEQRCGDSVLLSPWPDKGGLVGSVLFLVEGGLLEILDALPLVKHVLVAGGSPCVGFSRAGFQAGSQGVNNEESSKMWVLIESLGLIRDHRPRASVGCLLENVEMKEHQSSAITGTLGFPFFKADCALVAPAKRPRLFWQNLQSENLLPAERVDFRQALDPGWEPAISLTKGPPSVGFRFNTFLRPFQPGKPSEFPEPYPRLPLSQYGAGHLVVKKPRTASEQQKLQFAIPHLKLQGGDCRDPHSALFKSRAALCRWIHLEGGGEVLRPLRGHERDLCLGFPSGASATKADEFDEHGLSWGQMEASGNAFSPFVVSHFLKDWVSKLVLRKWPINGSIRISARGREAILDSLGGAGGQVSKHKVARLGNR